MTIPQFCIVGIISGCIAIATTLKVVTMDRSGYNEGRGALSWCIVVTTGTIERTVAVEAGGYGGSAGTCNRRVYITGSTMQAVTVKGKERSIGVTQKRRVVVTGTTRRIVILKEDGGLQWEEEVTVRAHEAIATGSLP